MLSLGQLHTNNDTNDADNDDTNNNDDNNTWQTNHDYIGSLACVPNQPKTLKYSLYDQEFTYMSIKYLIILT